MRLHVTDDQVRAGLEAVGDCGFYEDSLEAVRKGEAIGEMTRAMCLRPDVMRGIAALGEGVYPGGRIERALKELVFVEVSRTNECSFCTDSHVDFCRVVGASEDAHATLDALEGGSDRERAAIGYVRAMMRDSNRIPEETFERLREQFSEPEIVELTLLVGVVTMLNMFNNALAIRYHGEYAPPGRG